MDLINKSVRHKIFGKGTICELNGNTVSAQFDSGIKKFVFPDVFRKHLMLNEKVCKKYVDDIIKEQDQKARLKRQKRAAEAEKRKRIESLPLHPKSQAAFGFIDNDRNDVIDSRTILSGKYRTGDNRGKPRIPTRICPNSVCLLTFRDEKDLEENRYIWGAFMTKEDFIGSECRDGIIPAHDKYQVFLNDDDSKKLKFWPYLKDETKGKTIRWGSVEIKYFSNTTMACILDDILKMNQKTKQKQLCKEFLDHFCKLNKIDKNNISELKRELENS